MAAAVVGLGVAALIALVVVLLVLRGGGNQSPPQAAGGPAMEELVAGMELVAFEGVDQLGRPVDRSALETDWTVLSFGFTHCTLACPIMHGQMYRLAGLLEGHPVRLMTISVDPEHDTVERLAEYASTYGVEADRWRFVRVEPDTLGRLNEGLGLGLTIDPSLQLDLSGGGQMANIVHSTRLLLIGPGGEVVGLYRGMEDGGVNDLARDALARAERARG
jgi:protein SCO1/2